MEHVLPLVDRQEVGGLGLAEPHGEHLLHEGGRVHGLAGGPHVAVASVGSRPTSDGIKPLLEVHIFDFDRDIYGEYIQVDFIAWLREQQKFDGADDLVAQMHLDADNARSILADESA